MKTIWCLSFVTMFMGIFSCSGAKYINMDVTEFGLLLKEQEAALIDVRTQSEYDEGHIARAVNYDFYNKSFLKLVKEAFPKDKPLAVYCRSGKRSASAAKQLAAAGYTVYNLKGGYLAWTEAGRRVTKYEVETFRTKGGSLVSICLVKHGTLEIEYDGLTIHVDPVGEYGKHSRAMRDSLSLEKHVAKDCPPVFLVNCKDDPIVKYHNSELLDSALSAQGIRHRYIQYRTGGHGFGASETKGTAECRAWKKAFLNWLQEINESTSDKRHVSSQVTWHVR